MDGIVDKIGVTGLLVLLAVLCVVLFAYGIAQTFWGYKRRGFFRILPGLWSGLLISAATGFLLLMDGTRGDVIRFLMEATHGDILKVVAELIKSAVTNSKAFGQGLDIASGIMNAVGATGITDVVDTVRTMVIVGVLFSVICAVVSAAREKIGVALEFFAYGYTPVALYFAMKESTLLGAVLAIIVGALLGALGYRISRMWIIITTGLVGGLMVYIGFTNLTMSVPSIAVRAFLGTPNADPMLTIIMFMINFLFVGLILGSLSAIVISSLLGARGYQISRMRIFIIVIITTSLLCILLYVPFVGTIADRILDILVILCMLLLVPTGIYAQLKAATVPADKMAAQSAAAPVTLKSRWAAKFKADPAQSTEFVPEEPSAQPGAKPTLGRTPPVGGQKFCSKCGKPLEPGAKFCGKCGQPTRSEEDTAKPV